MVGKFELNLMIMRYTYQKQNFHFQQLSMKEVCDLAAKCKHRLFPDLMESKGYSYVLESQYCLLSFVCFGLSQYVKNKQNI